jgi:hypothetical protein
MWREINSSYLVGLVHQYNFVVGFSIFKHLFSFIQRDSLAAYNEATANASNTPQIVIEPPTVGGQGDITKTGVNENLSNCEAKNHTGGANEEDTAITVGMFQQENLKLCVLYM